MAENGVVLRKRTVEHIARAMDQSKFFLKKFPMTGKIDFGFKKACENFLKAPRGEDVKRVTNALRSTKLEFFRHIPPGDCVTDEIRDALKAFLAEFLVFDANFERSEDLYRIKEAIPA